jgi:hypothetical protein
MPNKLLCINLGGVVVGFEPADPEVDLFVIDSYQNFISREQPEIQICVWNHAFPQADLGASIFGNSFWSFFRTTQYDVIKINTRSLGVFPRTDTLVFSPGSNHAELYVEQDLAAAYPRLPGLVLPPFLLDEMMATCFLSQRDGLYFHACGMNAWGGRGFMFAGYSGTGKSTTARIWRAAGAAALLSDERVAVRKQNGQFWLHGTPRHSDIEDSSSPEKVALERIFILKHAAQNEAHHTQAASAVAALAARSYLPFWDRDGVDRALAFLDELTQAIPCYELGFVPDSSVVDYIKCLND